MLDAETQRYIKQEILRHLNVIVMSSMDNSPTKNTAKVRNMFGSGPLTDEYPVMNPYGFASRAATGVQTVLGRIGEHPGAKLILGHRDINKPDLEAGEVVLYNEYGQQIRLEEDKVCIGGATADQAMVLGDVLVEFLGKVIDMLIEGKFLLTTSAGNPTAPNPAKAADLAEWKATYLTTAATNILSALCYTQRNTDGA